MDDVQIGPENVKLVPLPHIIEFVIISSAPKDNIPANPFDEIVLFIRNDVDYRIYIPSSLFSLIILLLIIGYTLL